MNPPPLAEVAARTGQLAPQRAAVAALTGALRKCLRVSTVEDERRAASTDFAHLSPILPGVLPERIADVVARPRDTDELMTAVRLAHEHGVPIVARGRGTGNYGQAVPLAGGLVIDLSGMDRVLEAGQGWVHAEAGATFVTMEAAARERGQEIALAPTTMGSTIGGFLAGGAGGIGSIEHGWLWEGFTVALDVVTCPPGDSPLKLYGAQCVPYLHAYGVTGIIATATVRLAPARQWRAVLTSFPSEAAVPAGLELLSLDPRPRLVSVDEPALVLLYPSDPAMPIGLHSLRAVVDASTMDEVHRIVTSHGGRVEAVSEDAVSYLTSLAFNHVTLRARRARPDLCHLQVSGEALVTNAAGVRAALPGAMLHLDGYRSQFSGLLLSEYQDAQTLYSGVARLRELGVHVVDPHTWLLGGPALERIRQAAEVNDPQGLLNPGKLPQVQ